MAELDPRQHDAVAAGPVDLFVAAGAGSGKTRVLTARFVEAVRGAAPYPGHTPDSLVAVTYTEKAAGELAERIRGALLAGGDPVAARSIGDAWISTIHGMCARILRQHALRMGIDPHFRVLDAVESSAIEAEALEATVGASLDDEAFIALLEMYGFAPIASAAQSVRARMHALGEPPSALCATTLDDCRAVLRSAQEMFEQLAEDIIGLRQIVTVQNNAAAARSMAASIAESLSALPAGATSLLAAACACSFRHERRVEGLEELVDAARAELDRVREATAQLLVAEHEHTFVTFVERLAHEYARRKAERGALDFEDLQVMTAELLERDRALAARYRDRFGMLMLDEFQDTNALQLRIIEAIADGNLCTVGDENQSIYAFRHADVEVFRDRGRRCERSVPLDINYRTHPGLLAAMNGLFSHASMLGEHFMQLRAPATREPGPWPAEMPRFEARFIDVASGDADSKLVEAERIAERIEELLAAGLQARDIAVLMRALSGGRATAVEAALIARGIPVYIASGGSFFEQPEIIEMRALLGVISNIRDDAALATVLAGRLTGLSPDGLIALRAAADARAVELGVHRSQVHLCDVLEADAFLGAQDATAVRRTARAIEDARSRVGARPLADAVLEAALSLDFDLVLLSGGRSGERAWGNVAKLTRLAGEYERSAGGDLAAFLEFLQLREAHATSEQEATLDGESNAVRVMSIHAAKGLEFPAVIVAGLTSPGETGPVYFGRVEGRPTLGMTLPVQDKPQHTLGSSRVRAALAAAADAEAVRLLYVACTRAEEGLTIITRTDPAKDAGSSLGDLVRRALGMAAAGSLREGSLRVGEGQVEVRILERTVAASSAEAVPAAVDPPEVVVPWLPEAAHTDEPARPRVPATLSYTGLATYGRCPLRFFLTSVARLPAPPAAREGTAIAFGDAVHAVLARCASDDTDPQPHIAQALRAAGLPPSDAPRLAAAVRAYLSSPLAASIRACAEVQREAPITVPVGKAVLVGAIDCIGWHDDSALIVDYKTGVSALSEDEARERYDLQGACYALAAFATDVQHVRVVFTELERGREIAFDYAAAQSADLLARIVGLVERMHRDGYPAREAYAEDLCETCPGLGGVCAITRPSAGGAG